MSGGLGIGLFGVRLWVSGSMAFLKHPQTPGVVLDTMAKTEENDGRSLLLKARTRTADTSLAACVTPAIYLYLYVGRSGTRHSKNSRTVRNWAKGLVRLVRDVPASLHVLYAKVSLPTAQRSRSGEGDL